MKHELGLNPHWLWLVPVATSLLVGGLTLAQGGPEPQPVLSHPAPVATGSGYPAPAVDPSLPPAPPAPTF